MEALTEKDLKSGWRAVELWMGVLLAPLATLSLLETNYALVPWACAAGREWPMHAVALFVLIFNLAGTALSYRNWKGLGSSWKDEGGAATDRSRFMAALGILIGLLMSLVVLALWIPVFVYGPCQR